ncbi:putative Mitogen-activated protein kinase kinase kinase [Candidatus Roizmanbacteria bacterium]|nr:putative Mitogen-activated protein kinase kinase kinase [Candidatus Roizmanbacteria bacterium]
MEKVDFISLIKDLFPDFKDAKITSQRRSNNGFSFLIQKDALSRWAKIPTSSQYEEDLIGIEQKALSGINNPYLIKLYDVRTQYIKGQRYDVLMFDYIDGQDLKKILKNADKPFSEKETISLISNITEAIKSIWDKGWVHQDIKPKNIIFDKNQNKFVLLDLGIAYYANEFAYSSGRHPSEYVSPEQLKAQMGERVQVTFSSDLFQLGIIAYESLTLQHPFKDDQKKSKINFKRIIEGQYKPISDFDSQVSKQTVQIIERLLNPNAGHRYRDPEDLLCNLSGKEYKKPLNFKEGVYFQVWPGPQGYNNILDFISSKKPSGVVIGASQIPSNDFIVTVKEKGYKLIIDPETFLLQEGIHHSWHGDLAKQNWYMSDLNPSLFAKPNYIKTLIAGVFGLEASHNVDYFIPPYFNIPNYDDEWRHINRTMFLEFLKYSRRLSENKPILCGISISESIINTEKTRKEIVDFYSQFYYFDAFFLRLDVMKNNSPTLIKSVSKLIEELQYHKPVLLADADLVAFGYMAKGLSSLSTSTAESKRKHNLASKNTEKKGGGGGKGGPKDKFFVPKLLQFVKVEGDLSALIRVIGDDALCACDLCKTINKNKKIGKETIEEFVTNWKKGDKNNHFFCCLSEWKDYINSHKPEERLGKYKELIDRAKNIYKKNKEDLKFVQIISNGCFKDWEDAFFST